MQKSFIKIGHRGACGYAPENTLASFKKALMFGVDVIEFDVHTLKDGATVVFHDDTLERTTDGEGALIEKSLEEIRKLNAGGGEKVPTINEALECINRKAQVNIELKGRKTARPVADIIKTFVKERGWAYDDFLVSSFNLEELRDFRQFNDVVRLGIALSQEDDHMNLPGELGVYFIAPDKNLINVGLVEENHAKGFKVFPWTANDKDEIVRMKQMGVDGVFSDYPDRL